MEQYKEYFAFISYQRKDEEWADRLRSKLEHYRLPSSVRKQDASLPKEIRPIFRDALELAGGVLAKEIETALQLSKFLIVICSPNSAKSPWVNKEIQTFIDLGRTDRIIPFIIDGTPFTNDPSTECFPPALRSLQGEKELLGININEMGRDAAAVKVVARMFGLRFDTLYQRYQREQKKRRRQVIAAIVLAFLFLLGITGWIWHQNVILEEREWKMMENQARAVAGKALQLLDDGDSYLARCLSIAVLPERLDKLDRPYMPEVENVLRKACRNDNAILRGHTAGVEKVSYSPDGKKIVSASYNEICLWNPITGKCEKKLYGHTNIICSVSYSPDGKYLLSTSGDNTIRIWDVESGSCIKVLEGHKDIVYNASFSSDGRMIVSGSGCPVENTEQEMTHQGEIKLWDVSSGKCVNTIEMGFYSVFDVCFSPDNKSIIAASENSNIYIWNISLGKFSNVLKGHSYWVNSVKASTDGKYIISASEDNTICLWDQKTGKSLSILKGHTNGVNYADFDPDGNYILSASKDSTVRVWDIRTRDCIKVYRKHTKGINHVIFSSNGLQFLSASDDMTIRIWDWHKHDASTILEGHKSTIMSMSLSPNGKQLASSTWDDHSIRVWDVENGDCNLIIKENIGHVYSVLYDNSGNYIIAGNDNDICIWNSTTGELVKTLKGHADCVCGVKMSPNGKWIMSESFDYSIRLWDINSGNCIKVISNSEGSHSGAFSLSGEFFVAANNYNDIVIWDVTTGDISKRLQGHLERVSCITISPDGQFVLSASEDKTIRIWNISTGECVSVFNDFNSGVNSAYYNSTGDVVIAASNNGNISLWDVKSKSCIDIIQNKKKVNLSFFLQDGKHIVSGCDDGTIRIYDWLSLQDLIDQTRERFKNRPLTPEERRKYYLE